MSTNFILSLFSFYFNLANAPFLGDSYLLSAFIVAFLPATPRLEAPLGPFIFARLSTALFLAGDAYCYLAGDACLYLAGDACLYLAGDACLYLAGDSYRYLAGEAYRYLGNYLFVGFSLSSLSRDGLKILLSFFGLSISSGDFSLFFSFFFLFWSFR